MPVESGLLGAALLAFLEPARRSRDHSIPVFGMILDWGVVCMLLATPPALVATMYWLCAVSSIWSWRTI